MLWLPINIHKKCLIEAAKCRPLKTPCRSNHICAILSLTHGSGNVSYAETYGPDQNEEKGLISGIVKENNLSLGYLTLYFEDGSGSNPDSFDQLISTRNFT